MHIVPKYTLTNESITVIWEGKAHTVQKGAPNYTNLRKAIIEEDWEAVPKHLTVVKSLHEWAKGKFTLAGESFSYEGVPIPADLNKRIIQMATHGDDPTSLFNFWERLQKNPSYRSVNQLFKFLQHEGIPITKEGKFLAYKSVRSDYKDHHSGQFDNSPGTVNKMPRNQISDDPQVACHDGFHVGALGYAKDFGSGDRRVVICEIDPEHVVCVPYDHSQQKMRVCEYKVIGNHNGTSLPSTTFEDDVRVDDKAELAPEVEEDEEDPNYDPENDPLIDDEGDGDEEETQSVEAATEDDDSDVPVEKPAKKKSNKGFAKFDKMGQKELMDCSIEDLRQYAGKGLDIIGASKIPGGKTALVARILEVRQ